MAGLAANPNMYTVSVNDTEMKYVDPGEPAEQVFYMDTGDFENYNVLLELDTEEITYSSISVKCPTDITNVEVTVTKK